jgi:hypothetical protein
MDGRHALFFCVCSKFLRVHLSVGDRLLCHIHLDVDALGSGCDLPVEQDVRLPDSQAPGGPPPLDDAVGTLPHHRFSRSDMDLWCNEYHLARPELLLLSDTRRMVHPVYQKIQNIPSGKFPSPHAPADAVKTPHHRTSFRWGESSSIFQDTGYFPPTG